MSLVQAVKDYYKWDRQEKEAQKNKKPLNEQIKQEMKDNELTSLETDECVAVYGEQERTSMNEEKLIETLKELGFNQAIKTREVVDQKVVEDLIYAGQLNPADLDKCLNKSTVVTLSVKPLKKGKKQNG